MIYNTNYFAINSISTISQRRSEIENVLNVIVTTNDSNGNQANQYVIVNVKDIQGEVLNGIDTLTNIENLTFADKNALITNKEINPIDALGFQAEKDYSGKSDPSNFMI